MVLKNSYTFSLFKCSDSSERKLYILMTQVIMPDDIQDSLLHRKERGEIAYKECGEKNM